jgi:hypothetical protein
MHRALSAAVAALILSMSGCGSAPKAEVSRSELEKIRTWNQSITIGDPKAKVLKGYAAGNTVKLGSSAMDELAVEEWKAEAYHDESKRKDLFVTFLYFADESFVDSSDTRIDFRSKPELVERWRKSLKK